MSPLSHDANVKETLLQAYAVARQNQGPQACIVVLHIGAEQSGIAVGLGPEAVVEGSPAAHQGLPQSNSFAAALLILREFMHHLQFVQIEVLHAS